jgi:hypothetical protein
MVSIPVISPNRQMNPINVYFNGSFGLKTMASKFSCFNLWNWGELLYVLYLWKGFVLFSLCEHGQLLEVLKVVPLSKSNRRTKHSVQVLIHFVTIFRENFMVYSLHYIGWIIIVKSVVSVLYMSILLFICFLLCFFVCGGGLLIEQPSWHVRVATSMDYYGPVCSLCHILIVLMYFVVVVSYDFTFIIHTSLFTLSCAVNREEGRAGIV